MSILTKNKTAFEPQLLYVNKVRIKQRLQESKELEHQLNEASQALKNVFKEPLTDPEILQILRKGYPGLIEKAQQISGFPGADPETVFKLLAIDPTPSKNAIAKIRNRHQIEEFDFKNGQFQLSKEAIEKFEKVATYHTTNEKQNIAFTTAKTVADALNDAIKAGVIYEAEILSTGPLEKLLSRKKADNGKWIYRPHVEKISML